MPRSVVDFLSSQSQNPSALLLWSGDYSTFSLTGYRVTIMPDPSSGAAAANGWGDGQNLPPGGCFAKLISHSASPSGATVHR
jgi:hypothetical protein